MRARLWKRAAILPAAALSVVTVVPHASADAPFFTSTPAMLTLDGTAPSGTSLLPIISVGDQVGAFTFEGIPDGIGAMPGAGGSAEVFVNHEQSRVPFGGLADFDWSSVSHLTLAPSGGVVAGSEPLPDSAGFQRFCSSTMAGPDQGLSSFLYLTGEEAPERVAVPAGAPYGPDPAYAPNNDRQSGYSVVLDPVTSDFTQVAGLGRYNHENEMVLPGGWDQIAILSGDDTFTPPAPASQLYLYLADDEDAIWADQGSLWAFQATARNGVKVNAANPLNDANDYSDISSGDHFQGRFIRVPAKIAKGLTSAEPQTALENWSNQNNVFQFIRIEDIAYDVNNPRVIYFADTATTRIVPDPATGRLTRGASGTTGLYDNGRVFRMELSQSDPKVVDSFSILLNGDTGGPGLPGAGGIHQPDNVATSPNSLMVQEDTAVVAPRVWRYDFATQTWSVLATVNDIAWESSGIVDASEFFGPGSWLLDVQAHNVFVGPTDTTTTPGVTYKREGGQLLLLHVPGS